MTLSSLSYALTGFAAGNLAIALPLALIAWWLQQRAAKPFLAHLVWLVVLFKLLTPQLYSLPVAAIPEPAPLDFAIPLAPSAGPAADSTATVSWFSVVDWRMSLVTLWLLGSVVVLVRSTARASRFNTLLGSTSVPAGARYQHVASALAGALGLKSVPIVMATTANVSPMVWWIGGPKRIYIPRTMLERLDHAEVRAILAHEIGHLGRGDHWVRWLEWLVCVALWWNPLAWWARRNLRTCEEICCDAFVLSRTRASRDAYAGALVSAMELLSDSTLRPSGLASHVNGGFIERRIRMILSGKPIVETPTWLRGTVIALAVVLLPLGLTLAQDQEDELASVRQWLESGVNSAFLTQEQADIMLRALESQQIRFATRIVDGEGNVIRMQGVNVPRFNVEINAELGPVGLDKALAFAEGHFAEAVAAGELSQQEADAILEDLVAAHAGGLSAGDGSAYYDRQLELGLIDAETGQRRTRILRDMEEAFNGEPRNFTLTRVAEGPGIAAVPGVPFHAGEPAVVELSLARPVTVEATAVEVVRDPDPE